MRHLHQTPKECRIYVRQPSLHNFEVFHSSVVKQDFVQMVGFEPTTPWLKATYSIQLSYICHCRALPGTIINQSKNSSLKRDPAFRVPNMEEKTNPFHNVKI